MNFKALVKNFFLPKTDRKLIIRIALVAGLSYLVFKYFLIPMRIHGESMEPTYKNGSFNFCKTFLNNPYKRGDVVVIKLSGTRVMYLKRIVALEGETVEFKNGKLLVNNIPLDEPYVKTPCDWNLPPRTVEKNHVYVVGDNRAVPIDAHAFGQVDRKKIVGKPLW